MGGDIFKSLKQGRILNLRLPLLNILITVCFYINHSFYNENCNQILSCFISYGLIAVSNRSLDLVIQICFNKTNLKKYRNKEGKTIVTF